MRFRNIHLLLLACLISGCASSSTPYFTARYHDALDIFTLTVGEGNGAKAKAGPFHMAIFYFGEDRYGLRGGLTPSHWPSCGGGINELEQCLLLPIPYLPPLVMESPHDAAAFFISAMPSRTCLGNKALEYSTLFSPFFAIPHPARMPFGWKRSDKMPKGYLDKIKERENHKFEPGEHAWQYLTQFELVAGLRYSLRIGFNPGELADFILGWTTLDIYGDDPYPDGYHLVPADYIKNTGTERHGQENGEKYGAEKTQRAKGAKDSWVYRSIGNQSPRVWDLWDRWDL